MSDNTIEDLIAEFEKKVHKDENDVEFWFARDIQKLLGYDQWRNFLQVISKAKLACEASNHEVPDHFADTDKMVKLGSGSERKIEDIMLTRYACYLIAQNGDPRKEQIAFAQTYFAIQTRRQELADKRLEELSDDEKRIRIRNQIKEYNKFLSSAAQDAGVKTNKDFAIFHSHGYQGLYNKNVTQIKEYKGIQKNHDILDRMSSVESAANLFRITQTEQKLRKENIRGKQNANKAHFEVGRHVREAMQKISGTLPEELPAAEHIRYVEKRQTQSAKSIQDESKNENISLLQKEKIREADVWKYALLVMSTMQNGYVATKELIKILTSILELSDQDKVTLKGRNDSKFSQIIRNLKSHRKSTTNFIYQGYAEAVDEGFKITEKGRLFVRETFPEQIM